MFKVFSLNSVDYNLKRRVFADLSVPAIAYPMLVSFFSFLLQESILGEPPTDTHRADAAKAGEKATLLAAQRAALDAEITKIAQDIASIPNANQGMYSDLIRLRTTVTAELRSVAQTQGVQAAEILASQWNSSLVAANANLKETPIYSVLAAQACPGPGGATLPAGTPAFPVIPPMHGPDTSFQVAPPQLPLPPSTFLFHLNSILYNASSGQLSTAVGLLNQYHDELLAASYLLPSNTSPLVYLGLNTVAQTGLGVVVRHWAKTYNKSPLDAQNLHKALAPMVSIIASMATLGIEYATWPSTHVKYPPKDLSTLSDQITATNTLATVTKEQARELSSAITAHERALLGDLPVQATTTHAAVQARLDSACASIPASLTKAAETQAAADLGEVTFVTGPGCPVAGSDIVPLLPKANTLIEGALAAGPAPNCALPSPTPGLPQLPSPLPVANLSLINPMSVDPSIQLIQPFDFGKAAIIAGVSGAIGYGITVVSPVVASALFTVPVVRAVTQIFAPDLARLASNAVAPLPRLDDPRNVTVQETTFRAMEYLDATGIPLPRDEHHDEASVGVSVKVRLLTALMNEIGRHNSIKTKNPTLSDLKDITAKIQALSPDLLKDDEIQFALASIELRIRLNYPSPQQFSQFLLVQLDQNPEFKSSVYGTHLQDNFLTTFSHLHPDMASLTAMLTPLMDKLTQPTPILQIYQWVSETQPVHGDPSFANQWLARFQQSMRTATLDQLISFIQSETSPPQGQQDLIIGWMNHNPIQNTDRVRFSEVLLGKNFNDLVTRCLSPILQPNQDMSAYLNGLTNQPFASESLREFVAAIPVTSHWERHGNEQVLRVIVPGTDQDAPTSLVIQFGPDILNPTANYAAAFNEDTFALKGNLIELLKNPLEGISVTISANQATLAMLRENPQDYCIMLDRAQQHYLLEERASAYVCFVQNSQHPVTRSGVEYLLFEPTPDGLRLTRAPGNDPRPPMA